MSRLEALSPTVPCRALIAAPPRLIEKRQRSGTRARIGNARASRRPCLCLAGLELSDVWAAPRRPAALVASFGPGSSLFASPAAPLRSGFRDRGSDPALEFRAMSMSTDGSRGADSSLPSRLAAASTRASSPDSFRAAPMASRRCQAAHIERAAASLPVLFCVIRPHGCAVDRRQA